jgi:hypothetical protein
MVDNVIDTFVTYAAATQQNAGCILSTHSDGAAAVH